MSEKQKDAEGIKLICRNKRAMHDYFVEKRIEAGIVLKGSEVKSCRNGKVQLVDSYALVEKSEIFLFKAHIAEYMQGGPYFNHLATRTRKLLLHKKEIRALKEGIEQQGYTLIPLSMYFKKGVAKVELGLAKGKTKGDKRESEKSQEQNREVARAVRRTRAGSWDED